MIRRVIQGLVGALLGVLIGVFAGNPAVVGQDKIDRRDHKTDKNVLVTGKLIEESVAGLKVKVGLKEETIPAADVLRVYYEDIPLANGLRLLYQNLFLAEEKEKDLAKLIKDYRDLNAKVAMTPDVKPAIKRYIDYRLAMLLAAAAENDETRGEARRGLEVFVHDNPGTWEYPSAARVLARMHVDKLDYDNAIKVLDGLVRSAGVPTEAKQEAELLLIDVLFQAKRGAEVKTKVDGAMIDPRKTEPQKARLRVYLIGLEAQAPAANVDDVVKKLDDVVAKTPDNTVKALAYNIMGDCYMQQGRPRDAMWCYLWVDVVYSQDKTEQMKAMTRLLAIFEAEKDNEKALLYKEKIARLR
jgi:tetratricopeptide (TPR) repeat protein